MVDPTPKLPALSLFALAKFTAQAGQNLFFAALLVTAGTANHVAAGLSSFFVAMLLASLAFGGRAARWPTASGRRAASRSAASPAPR